MKKLTDFLEKNIQWLVLAIGVGYAVFMAWTYIIVPPVQVTLDGKTLMPGDVDDYVMENMVKDIQSRINTTTVRSTSQPANYVDRFTADMSYRDREAEPWVTAAVTFQRLPVIPVRDLPPGATPRPGGGPNPGGVIVTADRLPEIAPAKIGVTRSGTSNIMPAGQAVTAGATGTDKSWVSVRFNIDIASLVAAWDSAKVAPELAQTSFLQIQLERQELKRDGTWTDPVVVPALASQKLQPYPPAGAPQTVLVPFVQWSAEHAGDILQPQFHAVLKGTPWNVPGEGPSTDEQAPPQQFNPAEWVGKPREELMKLTAQQRQLVAQESQKQNRANRGGSAPARGPAGGRGRGRDIDNPAPLDPDRPINYQVARPPSIDIDIDAPAPAAAPVVENLSLPGQWQNFPIPTGLFDPRQWVTAHANQTQITCWAHDDTVVPGRTYRYRVSYKVKNPFALTPVGLVKNTKLTEALALEAPASGWTDQVEVASTISFWATRTKPSAGSVTIQVFRLQGGSYKTSTFEVSAGDLIGSVIGDVDYTTGWTMVDLRPDPRDPAEQYILLMDPSGGVQRRDVRSDSSDPNFLKRKSQVAAAPAAAAP